MSGGGLNLKRIALAPTQLTRANSEEDADGSVAGSELVLPSVLKHMERNTVEEVKKAREAAEEQVRAGPT